MVFYGFDSGFGVLSFGLILFVGFDKDYFEH